MFEWGTCRHCGRTIYRQQGAPRRYGWLHFHNNAHYCQVTMAEPVRRRRLRNRYAPRRRRTA